MNLEVICANAASKFTNASDDKDKKMHESLCRNARSILREEGLYSLYLYLQYRKDKGGSQLWKILGTLLQHESLESPLPSDIQIVFSPEIENKVIGLTENYYQMVFIRVMMRTTLTYAIYGLRAG